MIRLPLFFASATLSVLACGVVAWGGCAGENEARENEARENGARENEAGENGAGKYGAGPGGADAPQERAWHPDADWRRYWHDGKAEITRFELEQSRYGELRRGDAVMIFVTEDFLPKKQVKYEGSDPDEAKAIPVLKLNQLRKFETGVYDYSMMLSVFTPENLGANPKTLKLSASSQEWCGHVWMQANLRGSRYAFAGHSYFEREADESFETKAVLLEDEVWTRLRIAPESLPVGEVRAIPSSFDSRLRHYRPAPEAVTAARSESGDEAVYTLRYKSGRELEIRYEKRAPWRIRSWTESVPGPKGKATTRAKATHERKLAYWEHKANADSPLRKKLGLK